MHDVSNRAAWSGFKAEYDIIFAAKFFSPILNVLRGANCIEGTTFDDIYNECDAQSGLIAMIFLFKSKEL